MVRFIETENRRAVTRGWSGEERGSIAPAASPQGLQRFTVFLLPQAACYSHAPWGSPLLLLASTLIAELCHCSPIISQLVNMETSSSRSSLRSLNFATKFNSFPSFLREEGHRNCVPAKRAALCWVGNWPGAIKKSHKVSYCFECAFSSLGIWFKVLVQTFTFRWVR